MGQQARAHTRIVIGHFDQSASNFASNKFRAKRAQTRTRSNALCKQLAMREEKSNHAQHTQQRPNTCAALALYAKYRSRTLLEATSNSLLNFFFAVFVVRVFALAFVSIRGSIRFIRNPIGGSV